jgi:hypothetical protein
MRMRPAGLCRMIDGTPGDVDLDALIAQRLGGTNASADLLPMNMADADDHVAVTTLPGGAIETARSLRRQLGL